MKEKWYRLSYKLKDLVKVEDQGEVPQGKSLFWSYDTRVAFTSNLTMQDSLVAGCTDQRVYTEAQLILFGIIS